MLETKFFHLDCTPVIPECEYQCPKCIQEIQGVLGRMNGVHKVSLGEREGTSGIVVQYESETITDDQLIRAMDALPSFYQGNFVSHVVEF